MGKGKIQNNLNFSLDATTETWDIGDTTETWYGGNNNNNQPNMLKYKNLNFFHIPSLTVGLIFAIHSNICPGPEWKRGRIKKKNS